MATHSYANSRDQIHPDLANAEERKALPPVRWRMNWLNPSNGRRALYIASHAYAIDGMDDRDARQLLAELMDETTRREFVYVHKWRTGDVVMWDNRAMLHRGRPWDYSKERSMVRTTISATDADGLDQVKPSADGALRSSAGSAALQSRSSVELPHPMSGSGEPRSQPFEQQIGRSG